LLDLARELEREADGLDERQPRHAAPQ
jgi:hypothetical protein